MGDIPCRHGSPPISIQKEHRLVFRNRDNFHRHTLASFPACVSGRYHEFEANKEAESTA
jgi:hypothetical protein